MMTKTAPGFSSYICRSDGQIFTTRRWNRNKPKRLRMHKDKDGYLQSTFMGDDNKKHYLLAHRLIAMAFIGESDLQINHKNGIRTDNSVANLEYVTEQENQCHRRLREGHGVGVCWAKKEQKWRAYFQRNHKWEHIGFYDTKEEAKRAYLARLDKEHIKNRYDGRN